MFYTVFQKSIKNVKSTMNLIIILVVECLICTLPAVKISFTYLYQFSPSRCTLAKATDQHHERVSAAARLATRR